MRKKQIKQTNKEIKKILISEEFKKSACARHGAEIIEEVVRDMSIAKVSVVSKNIVRDYFLPVFFGSELPLQHQEEVNCYANSF